MPTRQLVFFFVIVFLLSGSKPIHIPANGKEKIDYSQLFGERYEQAHKFTTSNLELNNYFHDNDCSPQFMYSLVFPEIIRFSALQNKVEMASLFTLYIQFGSQYANYSVGPFQMKPAFAEKIEKDALDMHVSLASNYHFDISNTPEARRERVKRLNSKEWQAFYLILFVKIVEQKYESLKWATEEEKLLFFANAYNCGYHLSVDSINAISKFCYFHINQFPREEEKVNYSAIALDFYRNYHKK